ncbi:helix-turn-helix domain-containing protein [Streptomyces sp. NPDC056387]|uniref:helix-turn-helix domain-containing protein n=1 Tax=Streptomyces sp. NPDC056387 TaxID=3345803 RepID=UPI0035E20A63
MDSTAPGAAPQGLDAFRRGWQTQIGDDVFQLPVFSAETMGDFRVKGNVTKVHGAAIADLHAASATRTADVPGGDQDLVAMYIVRRGAWTLGGAPGHGDQTVSAGQFLVRHLGRLTAFETSADLTATFVVLPPGELKPLLGTRAVTGPAQSAEMRLLTALTDMIHTTVADLAPAGVAAAQSTLIELVKAVAKGRFDDVEPRLAPALTQAAKDLADRHLADPELSPAMLARALNVSVRTLHRAFAAAGEQIGTYIRQRRLHEARLALAAPSPLSISELAAHWQFADSSHFTRAFKKHYGQTPTEYARTAPAERRG